MSKILLLDIETMAAKAYVWSLWGDNIGVNQLIEPSRVICWAAKWLGEKETEFAAEWAGGRKRMLRRIFKLLQQSDAVLTYNGDKFDLPKLMGEFAVAHMGHPGPITSIDLYKTSRKLGFISNKLEFVAPHLRIGEKVKHAGFPLWKGVDNGNPASQELMEAYNREDTALLEELYMFLRPFVKNHPFLGETDSRHCPVCEGSRVQKRGSRRTKAFVIERLQCQDCGSWSDGTRRKVG